MFLSRAQQVLIVVCLVTIFCCAAYGIYSYGARRAIEDEVKFHESPFPAHEKPESIVIHVAGRVNKPGVYQLKPGSRVQDALTAARGAAKDADVHALNLAAFLRDGEKIWVPSHKETDAALVASNSSPPAASPRSSVHPSQVPRPRSSTKPPAQWFKQHKVNLNRATAVQLQQLPNIGPVLAGRIVRYRQEHGRFSSLEELLNVPGIGTKKFEQLRDLIVL